MKILKSLKIVIRIPLRNDEYLLYCIHLSDGVAKKEWKYIIYPRYLQYILFIHSLITSAEMNYKEKIVRLV